MLKKKKKKTVETIHPPGQACWFSCLDSYKQYFFENFTDAKKFAEKLVTEKNGRWISDIKASFNDLRLVITNEKRTLHKHHSKYVNKIINIDPHNLSDLGKRILKLLQWRARYATQEGDFDHSASQLHHEISEFNRPMELKYPQYSKIVRKENGELLTYDDIQVGLDDLISHANIE